MDLIKIGQFISELRKEKGFTQEQLGDGLGVTNKTVSRWETGTYLPPADTLLKMSVMFNVSVNELLSGKRLKSEEYKEAAEENLKQVIHASSFTLKDKIDFYKKKWLKEHLAFIFFLGLVVIALFITGIISQEFFFIHISIVLLIVFHCIRNNKMMTYVEKNAFDRTGQS